MKNLVDSVRPSLIGDSPMCWVQIENHAARQVLIAAAYCASNAPIPRSLLQYAAGLDDTPEQCDIALDELAGLGLLWWEEASADPAIYPLVASCTRAAYGRKVRTVHAVADALERLGREAIEDEGASYLSSLQPHVEAVLSRLDGGRRASVRAATLWRQLGAYRRATGDHAGAGSAFARALAILEIIYGPDHPDLAACAGDLGRALRDLGDLAKARVVFERALRTMCLAQVMQAGDADAGLATLYNDLGEVLHDLGDVEEARSAFERALAIDQTLHDGHHPDIARDLNNLGVILHALDDLTGARRSHERALRILEATLPPVHPRTAAALSNLGGVLRDLGDLDAARGSFDRALSIAEAMYRPDHPDIAVHVYNLGGVLRDLGDLGGARAAYERALSISERAVGVDHPRVATLVNSLGEVLYDLGDVAGAQEAFRRALGMLHALPRRHPEVRLVRRNLDALQRA